MSLTLRMPDDFHVHLRQGEMIAPVIAETAPWFGRILVMPNVEPPIYSAERLLEYRREIEVAASRVIGASPQPELLMTFKVSPAIPVVEVQRLREAGAIGGKLYPRGVTTNSADGVEEIDALYPLLEAMEEHDLVLEIHAEEPGAFSLDREAAYMPTISRLARDFPELRIVVEHVSSKAAVEAVRACPANVAATVTLHHLMLTLDDVVGDCLQPHHFCKPIAKRPEDLEAIREAVLGGDPRFFFGSDSAPHPRDAKESACGCAGIYTAPVALPLLVELFEAAGVALTEAEADTGPNPTSRPSLERFTSRLGAEFYRLPLPERSVTLAEIPWTVPASYAGVVPYYAGATLRYTRSD
ncbi:MAG: dihydroorotase [Spirochaetales bacterium]